MIRRMAFDPQRVRAVLFDIDGTLRDTDDELAERAARAVDRFLGAHRAERVTRWIIMRIENPVQHLFSQADRFDMDAPLNRLAARLSPGGHGGTRLVPTAGEAVRALHGRGLPLGIVSAGPEATVLHFMDEHGLTSMMDVVMSGLSCRRTKPHPEPVLAAMAALGLPPSAGVMVGDLPVDIRAGRAAGAQTVGVLTGFATRRELERAGADLIVGHLDELVARFA